MRTSSRDVHVGTCAITRLSSQVKINNTTAQRMWCTYIYTMIRGCRRLLYRVTACLSPPSDRRVPRKSIPAQIYDTVSKMKLLNTHSMHSTCARISRTSENALNQYVRSQIRPRSTFTRVSRALVTAAVAATAVCGWKVDRPNRTTRATRRMRRAELGAKEDLFPAIPGSRQVAPR